MVTIKDIANKMGIHFTTVSKALRNHPDISQKTKDKILAVAKEMDYHPNTVAQSFKRRKSNTIGVIVPQIENDFFSSIISGIEEIIYDAGFTLMICQSNESYKREVLHMSTLISNQVAGVLVAISKETSSSEHFETLKRRGINYILFDRILDNFKANSVIADDYKGAFEIVDHLIKAGHRKIAHFAGPKDLSVGRNRKNGYLDALKKHNIEIDEDLIMHDGFSQVHGENSFKHLMKLNKKPDAIFCVNDIVAYGAYKPIKSYGFHIPDDIAIAGFGNNMLSDFVDPPLTTVNQSPYVIGRNAAKMILKQILKGSNTTTPETKIINTELIIRKST